jgi:hypothetical protein
MQCQKKKRDGNQCRARARSGQNCCALHAEPGKAAELGSKGGRRRAVYSPEGYPPPPLSGVGPQNSEV